jgi:hypothetical protein
MKFKMAAMGKMFQNASSLKPLGQLKPNCPGMIIERFSTNFMFFMPIGNPRWPPPQYKRLIFNNTVERCVISKHFYII